MNELSQFLVESILGEADSVSNKVVVYSGRFQPFHKGHYATYSHLVKKFGKQNVFIGTSNKTDNKKSPFNFKEKKQIMTTMFGIPSNKIVEVKNPYVPTEVLKKFDKDTTSFITVVGKKDANRLGGKFFTPYKDNLDFEGYEDKGYVYIAPQQSNPISGTDVRMGLRKGSDEDKKEFFTKKAYGKFNPKIFKFIAGKLSQLPEITSENIWIPKHILENWIVDNTDLINEVTTTMGRDSVDDGPNYIYPNFNTFNKVSQKRAEEIGYTVLSQIMSDELTDIDDHPIYPKGPIKAVTPFPAGVAGKTTSTNQKDFYGSEAYNKWFKHIAKIVGIVGYSFVDYIDLNIDKTQSLRDLDSESDSVGNTLKEDINLPVNVGDTILTGRFKNKKTVVKTIGKDEHGMPTINGRKVVNFRIVTEGVEVQLNEIPMGDLQKIDTFADKQFKPVDVVLTGKHFFDRLNDPRNGKEVTNAELIGFFKRLGKKKKDFVNFLNQYNQIVAKDNRTNLNIPFMKQANKIIAKTIMRKDDFKTSSPEYKFEDKIPGGLAGGMGLTDIAKHHNISVDVLVSEFKKGISAEMEHTTDREIAKEITLDHLYEDPQYYTKLSQIEEVSPHGYPDQKWIDDHNKELKRLRKKFDKEKTNEDTIKHIGKSLGVARKDMPQINSKDVSDFVKYLKNNKVSVSASLINISKVKMTQKDLNVDKVKSLLGVDKSNLSKPVIISKDNYILDGHHRVAALYNLDDDFRIKTIKVGLGIKDLLKVAKDYPKVSYKSITERIDGDSIVCDNCGWNWKIKDGGNDLFICHKCGHDNEPNYTTKEINEMIRLKELLNEVLLTEGGAYGHMNHPFDTDINLTFGQLKDIVNKALEGNLELAREKTDGQALAVSWRDGRLVAARNKGHLKNKGENALDINGVATKFAGRGELEKAYNFAMNDLSKAIKSLSDKQREKIFKGGSCFMNLEVIYPTSVNVIPYGQALLVFHGTMEYNEEGVAIGENQAAARILAGMIKQVNQDVQSAYTIQGPPINELPKSKNLSSLKGNYNGKISKLQSKFKLKDTDGIADYHQAFWMDFVTKKSPTKLDNRTLMGLVKRWAFNDKSFRLDKKNFSDEKTLEWAKGIDKNDHAKMAKDNIRPFEDIFLGVGADILSFMSSVLAANPDKAVRDMKKRLDKTIKDVKKSGDEKKINKLKLELQRLNAIGGKDKIVPNEGIVFVYNGKTFKLTGTFAPLNQILGLFYE